MTLTPFHLAVVVTDLNETRRFYRDVLGCSPGRESDHWIDFDFFGHQLSCHRGTVAPNRPNTLVDGVLVPANHFGVIMGRPAWDDLIQRLRMNGVEFLLEPQVRYENSPARQGTFFIQDPSGNGLEFKTFDHEDAIFDGR